MARTGYSFRPRNLWVRLTGLQGTGGGGQFHVGAHRWPLGYTARYRGPVDLFLRP